MRFAALAVLLALASCGQSPRPAQGAPGASPPTASARGEAPKLTADGYGEMRVGMTLADARRVSAQSMAEEALEPDEPGACVEQPYNTGDGDTLWLMFEGDRITRLSASENGAHIRTAQNVGVGSTDAQVRAAYPHAIEQGAHYNPPPAHNLVVWIVPEQSGLLFEVSEGGTVTAVHAGGPSILYMEGCA